MIIGNFFFLAAGVMALAFSAGHTWWGENHILGDVRASGMPAFTRHMLLVIWNQPSVFHLASAGALLIAALSGQSAAASSLALFIGVVSFGFFLNYVVSSLIRSRDALAQIIPQAIVLAVYLGVIAAGIYA